MTEIPASLVKQLREETSAGMMDCKRALQEADGDYDAARTLLRERGMAQAGKRADRDTTEGIVLARVEGAVGSLVAVGCESEPVSRNDGFRAFAERALAETAAGTADVAAALEQERVDLVGKIGENIQIRGTARYEAGAGETLGFYVHPPANKIGVLVHARGGDADAVRRVAMHISFGAPRWITRDQVPAGELESERQIYLNSDEVKSKPEQAREKIVDGMLGKRFYAAQPGGVLLDQPWIHDSGKTVGQALSDEGIEVVAFERFALAG